jgi:hypothetical protein
MWFFVTIARVIHVNPFRQDISFWEAAIHPAPYGMKLEVGGFGGDDSW